MRKTVLILLTIISLVACVPKKMVVDKETLPKDIALKPEHQNNNSEENLDQEAEDLRVMLASIDSLSASKICENETDWRISPLGSKPCGGPASYLAYHKEMEVEIIPKIQEYTRRQAAYNLKRNLFSDCVVEPQPSGIRCENGKVFLKHGNAAVTESAQ